MARRKKSSRRSLEAKPSKSLAVHGVNFFALVLGLTAASLVLLLLWNFVSSPGTETGSEAKDVSRLEKEVTSSSDEDFEVLVTSSDDSQIWQMLEILDKKVKQPKAGKDLKTYYRRIQIIDKLLDKSDRKERIGLVISKLESLKRLLALTIEYEIDSSDAEQMLQNFATEYSSDGNPKLSILSRITLIELESRQPSLVRKTAEKIYELISEFPDNVLVTSSLKELVENQIDSPRTRSIGIQLAKAVVDRVEESEFVDHRDLSNVLQDFRDWTVLGEEKFFEAWESRSFSGEAGFDLLEQTAVKLAQSPRVGPERLRKVLEVGAWFELNNRYSSAISIYREINEQAKTYQLPSVSRMADQMGQRGLKRCESINKKIDLVATKVSDDTLLNAKHYQGRMVVLVYFSMNLPDSVEILQLVHKDRDGWSASSVEVLAVCIDSRTSPKFNLMKLRELSDKLEGWTVCMRDREDRLPLLDQCPSARSFRIALLDDRHLMSDVDVLPNELRASISFLQTANRQR